MRSSISVLFAPALFVLLATSCGAWSGDDAERFLDGEAAVSNTSSPEGFAFSYKGGKYFVREGGAGVSTDRSAPGDPATTIESAPDGSTIVFLPGKYRSVHVARPKDTGALRLVSEAAAFESVDWRAGTLNGVRPSEEVAFFERASLDLTGFSGLTVEGFRFSDSGESLKLTDSKAVITKCRFERSGNTGLLANGGSYWAHDIYAFNDQDRHAQDPDTHPERDIGDMHMDYGVRIHRTDELILSTSLFKGRFNHCVSSKDRNKKVTIRENHFEGAPLPDGGVAMPYNGIEAGQEGDQPGIDKTSGSITITGNVFALTPVSSLVAAKNSVDIEITNNRVVSGSGRFVYVGLDTGTKAILGSLHPERVRISDNELAGGSWRIDVMGRGRKKDLVEISKGSGADVKVRTMPEDIRANIDASEIETTDAPRVNETD